MEWSFSPQLTFFGASVCEQGEGWIPPSNTRQVLSKTLFWKGPHPFSNQKSTQFHLAISYWSYYYKATGPFPVFTSHLMWKKWKRNMNAPDVCCKKNLITEQDVKFDKKKNFHGAVIFRWWAKQLGDKIAVSSSDFEKLNCWFGVAVTVRFFNCFPEKSIVSLIWETSKGEFTLVCRNSVLVLKL